MVEIMDTSQARNMAGVGRQTRLVAEEAARRAGMRLEEWLDHAVEQALETSARAQVRDGGDDWPDAERRLDGISRRERGACGPERYNLGSRCDPDREDARERDGEDLLGSAIERFERRFARSEERAARAFESIARMIERSNTIRNDDLRARLEAARRPGATDRPSPREPAHALESVAGKPRLDLKDAVSQIAMRRQELEARGARNASAIPRPERVEVPANVKRGDAGQVASEDPSSAAGPSDDPHRVETPPAAAAPASLVEDLRVLVGRLDDLRREQAGPCVSAAEVDAMRVEIAAMTRSLADLAPRNAVVALEGAIRDLTERVAMLRENGHGKSLLAPLDAVAAELRASLKAHDPREAAAGLEREIRAIGGKIDGLAESAIDPDKFERIRRQTEEVRNLLAAAAMRSAPVERLERQIGELADRVEQLAASPAPHIESAQMAASLDDMRKEFERSTPLEALSSIERRLEQIAERLDREISRPTRAVVDSRPFDDLASRIDGVRQSLEARAQPLVDASALEASLKELNARLDKTEGERDAGELQSLLKHIAARMDREIASAFDASARKDAETHAIEPLLAKIVAKLDAIGAPTLDRSTIEDIADQVTRRLEHRNAGQVDAEVLAEQIANIHDRLDAPNERTGRSDSVEPLVRELLEKLREASAAPIFLGRDGSPAIATGLLSDLADLRAEQAEADRRTHTRLSGLQDILEKLAERLASIESGMSDDFDAAARPPVRAEPARKASAAALPGVELLAADDAADFSPHRRAVEAAARADAARPSPKTGEDDQSLPSPDGEDFLLEPGVGAPRRARETRDPARATGARTNPTVSVHIAAARRAAQLALAESNGAATKTSRGGQPVRMAARGVEQAKAFYANHKRPVLLGVALLIAATVAIRLVGLHSPLPQKSGPDGRPAKAAAADAKSVKPIGLTGPAKTARRLIDSTPTGSIAPAPEPSQAETSEPSSATLALPPDLLAAIPAGISEALRDSVVAGAPGAQYELAQRLFEGRGLPRDQQAAALWFERAASLGLAPAQYRLGAMYEKGVGVARDLSAAKRWYLKAAEAGNARAAHNLAVMNAEPAEGIPDYVEAANWFRKAGQMGVRDSQFNLAILYARGLGVGKDLRQSWLWFSLAAAQGDVDAAKKRDEVAAKMDPAELAAAADALGKFKVVDPDPIANEVIAPPGGWDAKPASPSVGKSGPPSRGGARPQTPL